MKKTLYDSIQDALKARTSGGWEARQQTFYTMRNGGLRRSAKPYPGAPDLHFPLGDSLIEKIKPMYIQQMYGSETIASFTAIRQQDSDITSAASYWFDYNLKQRSNFERTMFVAIDEMLQDGFTPVKVYWDHDCKRLAFDQIDPLHLIVPESTQEINQAGGADWVVHIIHLSEAEYRSNDQFKQDDDYIKTIKGKGDGIGTGDNGKRQSVELREGINCSQNSNEIVLWEVYNRNREKKTIEIETISPLRPRDDEEGPVREPFGLPYNKGMFKKGDCFPFFKIRSESKGKGHYSSRGIIEINAAFEASLCKTWNTLHEWQDFFGRPQFYSEQPIPNASNYKTKPGGILPAGLKPVEPPPAPSSLREDMEFTRSLAEYRTAMPDLGAAEHLTPGGTGGKVTATQINAIVGQSGQGNDMRARVFKLDLGEGLALAWSLCLQYAVSATDELTGQPDQTSLVYIVDNEIKTLDQSALHDDYEIVPNGSADSWNKGAQLQKRLAFYQQFNGNPYIAPDELTKWVLEGDDPRLVKRLYRDPGAQQADQMEQQASEIALMMIGYPPPPHPSDDPKAHLQCCTEFTQRRLQMNEPITQEFAGLMIPHIQAHMQQLAQNKDPAAKQIGQMVMPIIQLLTHVAQTGAGDPNLQQPQEGTMPSTPDQSAGGQGAAAPSQDRPSAVMNGMAALIKAGAPIGPDDISAVLVSAGLPPLSMNGQYVTPPPPQAPVQAQPTPQMPAPQPVPLVPAGGRMP